jgi:hypothetical protein
MTPEHEKLCEELSNESSDTYGKKLLADAIAAITDLSAEVNRLDNQLFDCADREIGRAHV